MNKKSLLCTTIASTMLLAGITFPMSNAAVEKKAGELVGETTIAYTSFNITQNEENVVTKNAITIELTGKNRQLTEENLETIVKQKFGDDVKFEIIKNGNEEEGLVGTGTKVKISDSKVFVVELLGDVDGTGTIDENDAQQIFNYAFFEKAEALATDSQKVAANVEADEAIDENDAQQIFNYAFYEGETTDGKMMDYVDNALPESKEADEFKMFELSIPEDSDLAPEVKTAVDAVLEGDENNDNLFSCVANGNTITVNAKLESMESVEKPNLAGVAAAAELETEEDTTGKWFMLPINTGIEDYTITGVETKQVSEDHPEIVILLLNAEETQKVTITNNKDTSEVLELNVNVVDVQKPQVIGVTKTENEVSGQNQASITVDDNNVETEFANTGVQITCNLNTMEQNNKKYKLDVKVIADTDAELTEETVDEAVDLSAEKVVVLDEEGNVVGTGTGTGDTITISVDGSKGTSVGNDETFSVLNANMYNIIKDGATAKVNAEIEAANEETEPTEEELAVKYTEKVVEMLGEEDYSSEVEKLKITTKVEQKINISAILSSKTSSNTNTSVVGADTVTAYATSGKIDNIENNVIEIKGARNKMKPEALDENNAVKSAAAETDETHLYYGLVIDTDYKENNDDLVVEVKEGNAKVIKVSNDNKTGLIPGSSETVEGDGSEVILILDAEEDTTKVQFRTKTDGLASEANKEYPEIVDLTINFKDTSEVIETTVEADDAASFKVVTPNATDAALLQNEKLVESIVKVTVRDESTSDNKGSYKVNARMAGATTLTTTDENKTSGVYYPIIVNVGADNEVLNVEYPDKKVMAGNEGAEAAGIELAEGEIILWVKGDITTGQNFKITNKNKTESTAYVLTVSSANSSRVKAGTLTKIATTNLSDGAKSFLKQENVEAFVNNMDHIRYTLKSGGAEENTSFTKKSGSNDWNATYDMRVYANQLSTFKLYDVEGAWVALNIAVTDSTWIPEGWVEGAENYVYVDKKQATNFGSSNTKSNVLVWVNLAHELSEDNTIDFTLVTEKDNTEVVETVAIKLAIESIDAEPVMTPEKVEDNNKQILYWDSEDNSAKNTIKDNANADKIEDNIEAIEDITVVNNEYTINISDFSKLKGYKNEDYEAGKEQELIYIPVVFDLGEGTKTDGAKLLDQEGNVVESTLDTAKEWCGEEGSKFIEWFVLDPNVIASQSKITKKFFIEIPASATASKQLIPFTVNFVNGTQK